jgi:hypothetical protein
MGMNYSKSTTLETRMKVDLSPLKLYKSDGTSLERTVGEEDFCGAGCLIVQGIRVPFPDCNIHGGRFTISQSVL